MPRFFFDVYNDFDSHDAEGVELADLDAVRQQVRKALPDLVKDVTASEDTAHFRVDVRNESGQRIVTSTILMVIQCVAEKEAEQAALVDHSEAFR